MKNCGRRFHEFVAQKEVLLAMSKLGASRRTEPEVRDKTLALIQDWSDAIRLAPYRDTFAELQQRGVDFPGRDVARMAPVHTPPASVPTGEELSAADAEAIALAIAQAEQEIATDEQRVRPSFMFSCAASSLVSDTTSDCAAHGGEDAGQRARAHGRRARLHERTQG